jgi:hypothetical protein
MNPIPHGGTIPTAPVFVDGYLELILVITVASLFVMFGMLLWNVRDAIRERRWIFCPVRLRVVKVLFRLAPNGERTDVIRCSVFGRRPLTCGKACLHHGAAA